MSIEMSVCCWQYAAISRDAMSIVAEASVARISVIRFQSCAKSGSVYCRTSWQFVTASAKSR
ncbi:hypothetical protein [Streptomyces sp. NPDC047981]|uniref:hypothetical protein n=1 Tax=Streptomyces sp. NPDC047981 TaxID=3154610 RepID=UPI00341442D1